MIIKGLDNGYLYTKDNEHRIFKSSILKDYTDLAGSNNIIVDGISYCVGTGKTTVDLNKTQGDTNKICTLLNLAMTGQEEYFLVVGLPIRQFKSQKAELREEILKYNRSSVIYKERPIRVDIKDVFVLPQGAAALLGENNLQDGRYIIVDIGGLSIDVADIEIINGSPIMHKHNTWFDGMQKLYADIIYEVNNKYNLTLSLDYAETIFKKGLFIDGAQQDISFLNPIKEDFLSDTIKELKLNYNSRTTPIKITGGGGISLYNTLAKEFKGATLIQNSQFANARGYHKMGLIKWRKYITIPMCNKNLMWEFPNGEKK